MAQAKRRKKRKIFSPVYLTLVLIVLYPVSYTHLTLPTTPYV